MATAAEDITLNENIGVSTTSYPIAHAQSKQYSSSSPNNRTALDDLADDIDSDDIMDLMNDVADGGDEDDVELLDDLVDDSVLLDEGHIPDPEKKQQANWLVFITVLISTFN